MGVVWVYENPFDTEGTGFTSKVLDCRDAYEHTLSFRTVAGSRSTVTLQLSNAAGGVPLSIAEATWSNWTVMGTVVIGSATTTLDPPLGYRFMRLIRSDSSQTIEYNKQIRL